MFLEHFKLSLQPFGVTPDTRFLYLSQTHREALASLLYGIQCGRGFSALVASPGMGKTTLLFRLLALMEGNTKTAFLFQTLCTPEEFLRSLLADLGIEDEGGDVACMHAKLNAYLLEESRNGRRVVVVIDEAQNLDERVLEVLRMLSNFETPSKKLMHIVLAGQPQLAEKLSSERLTQLRQRISIVARLAPFAAAETREYIEHRLRMAGTRTDKPVFSETAYAMIAEQSGGIPRNINNLCFNSMTLACALQRPKVEASMVQEAINDLDLKVIASPNAPEVRRQPQLFSTFAGAAEPYSHRRYGLGLAIGILISLVWVTGQVLRSNRPIALQSTATVSQQKTNSQKANGGSGAYPVANVPAPLEAQAQNRTEEKALPQPIPEAISAAQVPPRRTGGSASDALAVSPGRPSAGDGRITGVSSRGFIPSPQELQRSKHSLTVKSFADEQRHQKARAAPREEHVPLEPTPQGEKP